MTTPASASAPVPETTPELVARIRAHLAAAGALLERHRRHVLDDVGRDAADRTRLMVDVARFADLAKAGDLIACAEELIK